MRGIIGKDLDAHIQKRAEVRTLFVVNVNNDKSFFQKMISTAEYDNQDSVLLKGKGDTVTSGKTISDSGKAIYEMFAPKSLTYITLFSALNDKESYKKKIDKI